MFSGVASTPSTFTALTVSFKEPSEIYPIDALSLSTVVRTASVED